MSFFVADSSSQNPLLFRWDQVLKASGSRPAISNPGTVLRTFAQIDEEARALQSRLQLFPAHSVIAVQIGNSVSWPALLIALFRAKLIPLPLGRHIENAELDLARKTCRAAGLITADADGLNIEATHDLPSFQWNEPVPDFLKLTSGTTSAPRAVRFRAGQLLADCENICATMGITDEDLNYGVIPFSHSYGFSNLIAPLIACGVPLVASEDRMPRAILEGLASSGATVFPGMPIFFQKLTELEAAPQLARLRLCISAGAPLPVATWKRFNALFGKSIHTFYGASECGGIGYQRDADNYEDGDAGLPMHGVNVEPGTGAEPARIVVRGAAVGDGYFPDSDDSALMNGAFQPTDIIAWTARGMRIVGRDSEWINVAGRKLNPLEIEQQMRLCPGIKEVVVFGIPSALRGEEPVACVAAGPETNLAEILRYCHRQLSPWQTPKDVWLVSEIPTNERGKISRRLLSDQYLTLTQRS